jgi:peptide/nickel transport system substrate-binding protein
LSRLIYHVLLSLIVVSMALSACAAPATPTVAPKAPATPVPVAPATAAAPAAASASSPTAIPKPAAPTATPAPKVKRGGVVRTSLTSDWGTADLHLDVSNRADQQVHHEALLDATMNDQTKRFELAPRLAESWTQPDPKTIVFKLRKGVKFHDGSSFNAEAAKWNLLRMKDHPKSGSKDNVRSVASVDAVDETTLRVNLKAPAASALWQLTSQAKSRPMMMSMEAYTKFGDDAMGGKLVGTGPFELTDWRKGDRMVFKKFASYWQDGVDGQKKPYLDGVEVRWIQDNSVAVLELRSGNMQLLQAVLPKDIPGIKSNPELVFTESPWRASIRMIGLNQRQGPFSTNKNLRLAAQYAIDREAMAKTLGAGAGSVPITIIAEGQTGYDAKAPAYLFDAEKAKKAMADAGFPSGTDVRLTVISRQPDLPQAEVIKSMWDKVGLRTTIDAIERIAWLARTAAFNYEATTYGLSYEIDPHVTLASRFGCEGNANFASWCSKEFDACLAESEQATTEDKRGDIFQRCLKIAYNDANYVHMWVQDTNDAYSKKIQGFRKYFSVMNFWEDLWLQ